MSQKLNSQRAKNIYDRIEREKENIRDSKLEIGAALTDAKDSVRNLKEHPMSLLVPQGFSQNSVAPRIVSKHPITATLGMLAVGWGMGYLMRNRKGRIALALAAPISKLAQESLNSNFAKKVVSELNTTTEVVLSDLFSKARSKIEEYVTSYKNSREHINSGEIQGDISSGGNDMPWKEAPPGRSTKTYYTH